MNAPETSVTSLPDESSGIEAAIVVDQLELFRLGLEQALLQIGVVVSHHTVRAVDGYRLALQDGAGLVIVGKTADLKKKQPLRDAKRKNPDLKVMFLVEQAQMPDVAGLVGLGVDALLLRSARASEIHDAIHRMEMGERVVASALAVGTLGRVGHFEPSDGTAGLSPKELEVLAELATGATYKEMAEALIVTQATVKTHLVHIYSKLDVKNRNEAVSRALALGLLG